MAFSKNISKELILILAGSFIFALGINYFAIPNKLAGGGIAGVTIITYYLFAWSPGLVNLALNIPLFFLGFKVLDQRTMIYTILGTTASSFFLTITESWGAPISGDPLLASLYAGVFVGVGLGLVFRAGGTTGGASILAQLGHKYLGWSIGRSLLAIDLLVLMGAYFVIGREKVMYTLVAVFIGARVVDFVIEGMDARKAVTIISYSAVTISDRITHELERGVTLLKGRGGYTGTDKEVLYIVINRQELPRLKQLVHQVDSSAFLVVHDVRDVLGEGFTFERTHS
ncbi:YitT family protein [Kroppenstedtia sanguinis]|uniref:YitT family protein n=1 Tax=Kroppenstedtia sanguinis TaxID=1380684 RepID=A0ABW4C619_9BACL